MERDLKKHYLSFKLQDQIDIGKQMHKIVQKEQKQENEPIYAPQIKNDPVMEEAQEQQKIKNESILKSKQMNKKNEDTKTNKTKNDFIVEILQIVSNVLFATGCTTLFLRHFVPSSLSKCLCCCISF